MTGMQHLYTVTFTVVLQGPEFPEGLDPETDWEDWPDDFVYDVSNWARDVVSHHKFEASNIEYWGQEN